MTKVDFYILPQADIDTRHHFACRLVEKAFRLGHCIYIHSDDNAQANALDSMLWSFRESSFIPHRIIQHDAQIENDHVLVHIGYHGGNGVHSAPPGVETHGLLVNLSSEVPEYFSRFERVSEIVVQHPQVQEATRSNFRFYRDRGYELQTHDMRR